MRKIAVLCLSAALLVGAAAPASAARPTKSNSSYGSASASWTQVQQVNRTTTRYTTWWVGTYVSDGWSSLDVSMDSYSCRQTRRGEICDYDGWGWGYSEVPTVTLASDLSSATASGTVSMDMYDAAGNATTTLVDVSAAWTATSPLVKSRGSYSYTSGCNTYRTSWRDGSRDATATATIGGTDLGASDYAGLYAGASRSMERYC